MANAVLPKVYTNMTTNEITALISEAVTYLGYDIVQNRIPFDGLYTSENGNLMPMYKETVEKFHDIIFEEQLIEFLESGQKINLITLFVIFNFKMVFLLKILIPNIKNIIKIPINKLEQN